jgi:UDP-N-acetylglucosamine/UDP-N-acetylgalactosamine diphosphorylase
VPFVNELSHRIRPRQPNANKFEMFVFDALPAARRTLVLEVAREDEFSPVKSLTGEDSVETAQRDLMRVAARWCRAAGVEVETDPTGTPRLKIEVSPLFATCEDEFVEKMKAAGLKAISRDTYFE